MLSRAATAMRRPSPLAARPKGPVSIGTRQISVFASPANAACRLNTDTSLTPPLPTKAKPPPIGEIDDRDEAGMAMLMLSRTVRRRRAGVVHDIGVARRLVDDDRDRLAAHLRFRHAIALSRSIIATLSSQRPLTMRWPSRLRMPVFPRLWRRDAIEAIAPAQRSWRRDGKSAIGGARLDQHHRTHSERP